LTITVDVEFLGRNTAKKSSTSQKVFHPENISQDWNLGTYVEPFPHQGKTTFKITVAFSPNDSLSFPTTISPNLTQVLASSLEGQMLLNTKFYLFSGKIEGKAGRPRAVYGNAALLTNTSTYMEDLLSDSGFQDGIPCGLYEDVPEVLGRLKEEYYDYESDSDLESLPGVDEEDKPSPAGRLIANVHNIQGNHVPPVKTHGGGPKLTVPDSIARSLPSSPPLETPGNSTTDASAGVLSGAQFVMSNPAMNVQSSIGDTSASNFEDPPPQTSSPQEAVQTDVWNCPPKPTSDTQVRAYAINGTAYQTWKAFIFYAYTGETQFKPLKSTLKFSWFNIPPTNTPKMGQDTACSPKSMYRFADYVRPPGVTQAHA